MFGWLRSNRSNLDPDVRRLSILMREIEVLLREGGSKHWATEVAKCAEVVERSDAYGLDRFLLLFGGMGSLNDLILQRDGCPPGEETDRLQSMLAEAWELSSRLKQERGN